MDNMFSAGELAKLQKISKQTLLFYDKIGLFKPSYVNPDNGYRYYNADQLDYLDTILIMRKVGFSLEEIKQHMKEYSTENSLVFLKKQIDVIEKKIAEWNLVKSRLVHRCQQVENFLPSVDTEPELHSVEEKYVLYYDVKEPYDMKEISIATKKCYAQALTEEIPIFYQCGVSVPLRHILEEKYTEATTAFVTTENQGNVPNIKKLPSGLTASTYHLGNYYMIEKSYKKLLSFCRHKGLKIISDSYEFCINDYITSKNEDEFITKIMFYVQPEDEGITKNKSEVTI